MAISMRVFYQPQDCPLYRDHSFWSGRENERRHQPQVSVQQSGSTSSSGVQHAKSVQSRPS